MVRIGSLWLPIFSSHLDSCWAASHGLPLLARPDSICSRIRSGSTDGATLGSDDARRARHGPPAAEAARFAPTRMRQSLMRILRSMVLVACLAAGVIDVYATLREGRYGWDYEVYCGSVRAVQAGLDPYLPENTRHFLGNNWVMPYPVGALVLLSPACLKPRILYPVFYTLLLALAGFQLSRLWPEQPLLLAALLVGGLVAAPYNYMTGNTGIVELVVFVAALAASRAGRFRSAGTWLGIVAAVKLTPLALDAVFAAVAWRERGPRSCVRLVLGIALGFAIVHGLSLLIDPRYELSLFRALSGGFPGQVSALDETRANWSNPALPLIIGDAVALLGGPALLGYALLGAGAVAAAALLLRLWRRESDALTLWSYAVLVVCLLLPRFKPYSFVYPLVPLFYLLHRKSPGQQALVMLVGSLLPLLLFLLPMDRDPERGLNFVVAVSQMLGLGAAFALLLWWDRVRWVGSASAAGPALPATERR